MMRLSFTYIIALLFSTYLMAADTCPGTSVPLISTVPVLESGTLTSTDTEDYFEYHLTVPDDSGILKIVLQSNENMDFKVGTTGCGSNDLVNASNVVGVLEKEMPIAYGETVYVNAIFKSNPASYDFKITFNSSDTPPVVEGTDPDVLVIDENTSNGTHVGYVNASDVNAAGDDTSDTLTYSIVGGNTGDVFDINATTGGISVVDNSTLEYDNIPEYDLVVNVTDSYGQTTAATIKVYITPDTNIPPVVYDDTFYVSQDASEGTLVGTVRATDSYGDELAYSFPTAVNDFDIDSDTGKITVSGDASLSVGSDYNITVGVMDNNNGYSEATITIIVTQCPVMDDFLTIDGSETELTGASTLGADSIADDGTYYKFNATGTGGDINGTLRINTYASNFNDISTIQLRDAECNPIDGFTFHDTWQMTMSTYVTTVGPLYLYMDDANNTNPQVVSSMIWYPDANSTSGGGGDYIPSYSEPAIFVGRDDPEIDPAGITTKVVNKDDTLLLQVVKDDGSVYTSYKGNVHLELIDGTDYDTLGCKHSDITVLEDYEIFGLDNTANGELQIPISYDRAHRNARYRMTYLVDPTAGGIITYEYLLEVNGCVGNTASCLWGMLTSLANGDDPYLPEFTIADVCGMYCDPGAGTGDNQISPECRACVYGQFGYSDCSDNFAIRPDHFEINSDSASYPDLLRAGAGYDLNITAVDEDANNTLGYNQASGNLDVSNPTKYYADGTPETNSTMLPGAATIGGTAFTFVDGLSSGTVSYEYSEVGDIAIHIEDQEWAAVDISNPNDLTPPDCSADGAYVCGDENATFIPDHFRVIVDLNNSSNGFTYLSNEQNMTAHLNVKIYAENEDNVTTQNFTMPAYGHTFYENNLTVLMTIPDHPILGAADTNGTETPTLLNFDHGYKQLSWNDSNATLAFWFHYLRETNVSVNPFILNGTDVVIDVNSTYPTTGAAVAPEGTAVITGTDTDDANITYVYGRAHMARTRTMCGIGATCTGYPIFYYEFYGDKDANQTLITNLLTTPQRSVDSVNWYKNTLHVPASDGNVTASTPITDVTASYAPDGSTTKGTFGYNTNKGYPYKVTVEVNEPGQTQSWLIYDKYKAGATQVAGQLEYYGPGKWSGSGGADTSVEDETGTTGNLRKNTNRRIRW